LLFDVSYVSAKHGPDYEDKRAVGDKIGGFPFMDQVIWENKTLAFRINYELMNNSYIFLEYQQSEIAANGYYNITTKKNVTAAEVLNKYTPDFYQGKRATIIFGLNIGF